MDNMDTVISALTPEIWSVRLDLQDAYFQIPIHQDSRHLLRFVLGSKVFQFRVLPFGLCSAPYLFTQVVNSVAALLRQRGINILTYLDDWLILCHSKDRLQTQVSVTLQILSQLGFVINRKKSDLIPTQTFQYLGVQFDTSKNYMAPSMENRQKLVDKIELIRSAKAVSAQTLLALLGSMNFAARLVWRGRLHMRPIQMWLLSRWKIDRGQLTDQIAVTDLLVHHLSWWTEERLQRGKHLFAQKPDFTIQSDASLEGWGGVLEGSTTRGLWSAGDRSLHINNLELMALFNCLKEFRHKIQGSTVLCQLDNSTAVWYLKKEGGTKSADLCLLVWEMLHWCDQNNIQLVVRHLPGHLNILADQLSRKSVHTEWSLHPSVFKAIVKKTDHPPVIDLFVTSLNFKLPSYFSPVPDPNAIAVDSLSEMDRNDRLRIPTNSNSSISVEEIKRRELCDHSYCSSLAKEILVLNDNGVTGGKPLKASTDSKTSSTERTVSQKSSSVQLSCMDAFRKIRVERGFSEKAADYAGKCIRDSSKKVYSARWSIFCSWCSEQQIDPLKVSAAELMEFYIYLLELKKLSVTTIKGYRSSIAHVLGKSYPACSEDMLTELFRGFTMSSTQRPRNLLPKWDLPVVLYYLMQDKSDLRCVYVLLCLPFLCGSQAQFTLSFCRF